MKAEQYFKNLCIDQDDVIDCFSQIDKLKHGVMDDSISLLILLLSFIIVCCFLAVILFRNN